MSGGMFYLRDLPKYEAICKRCEHTRMSTPLQLNPVWFFFASPAT